MDATARYGKPNMANLPPELGKAIFRQILNTPVPNDTALREENAKLISEMVRIREDENVKRNHAE